MGKLGDIYREGRGGGGGGVSRAGTGRRGQLKSLS